MTYTLFQSGRTKHCKDTLNRYMTFYVTGVGCMTNTTTLASAIATGNNNNNNIFILPLYIYISEV